MTGVNKLNEDENYEFDDFHVDVKSGLLTYRGQTVSIAPKVFNCLVLLLRADGGVVLKEQLLAEIWSGENPADNVLSYTISQLRRTLAAHAPDTKFIETLSKRGFRLLVPRRRLGRALPATLTEPDQVVVERKIVEEIWIEEEDSVALGAPGRRNSVWLFVLGAVSAVLVSGLAYFAFTSYTAAPRAVKSLAVLPLRTFGGETFDSELRLRTMDALITRLGGIRKIAVRPTSATKDYLNTDENPVNIGRRLAVDAVLDGRIQAENNKLRITLQLIDVRNGNQLWADQFDGEYGQSLDLQDAIAAKLVTLLDDANATETARRPTTRDAAAYEEYLRGRYLWGKRTPDELKQAIAAYQRAIDFDDDYADAYVGLADAYFTLADYGYDTRPEVIEAARRSLARGIELDPNLPSAFITRSLLESTADWNWKGAEVSARKAIELMPNSASGHHRLGSVLMMQRRFSEAETEFRRARELDPTSTAINMNIGVVLFFARRFPEARAELERTVELDRKFTAPKWYLARCRHMMGDFREAHALIAEALEIEGDETLAAQIRTLSDREGDTGVMNALLKSWEKQLGPTGITPHDLANINALLGNREGTLKWLEVSVATRHPWSATINSAPEFEFVRSDPRFTELLRKMNFE